MAKGRIPVNALTFMSDKLASTTRQQLQVQERVAQVAAVALLMGCITAIQTLCMQDRVCYRGDLDPAIPRGAARLIVPLTGQWCPALRGGEEWALAQCGAPS